MESVDRSSCWRDVRRIWNVAAAGFVRYAYGAPLALVLSIVMFVVLGRDLPQVPGRFWPTIAVAGVSQIVGTAGITPGQAINYRDIQRAMREAEAEAA